MPEMPLRVWWSQPNKWRVDRQPPLVALTDGLLVVVERNQSITHVSLAAAELTATAGGCTLRWHDGPLRPSLNLPEFAGQDELVEALRAARMETAPLRSHTLAKLFPVVPIRPFWSWIRAATFTVLFLLPPLIVRYLSWLALLPIWAAALWFEFTQPAPRWAMLTPDGLWVLVTDQEPVLISRDQITGTTTGPGGLTTLIHTAHPAFPTLPIPTGKGKALLEALQKP